VVNDISDHLYVEVVLGTARQDVQRSSIRGSERRWALTKLDEEQLETAFMATSWGMKEEERGWDIHQEVGWLRESMSRICDEAMPHLPRRTAYWWTDELAELRRSSVQARRALTRLPRRGSPEEREEALTAYRETRCALSRAIRRSREKCWDEMLSSLNTDPWGRPYKIVLKRHKAWTPPTTETLESLLLDNIVDTLFPSRVEG